MILRVAATEEIKIPKKFNKAGNPVVWEKQAMPKNRFLARSLLDIVLPAAADLELQKKPSGRNRDKKREFKKWKEATASESFVLL